MAKNPDIVAPGTKPRRGRQFRLRTLLIAVTLLGLLSGAIRWLFILAGVPVAVGILIVLWFAASSAIYVARGLWLWRQWCRMQSNLKKAREVNTTRVMLELEEVREAVRAGKKERLRRPGEPPETRS